MIVFDLHCAQDHGFEIWFQSSDAYEQQRSAGQVVCPFCGSTDVRKAVMAPRLAPTRTSSPSELIPKLVALQAQMLAKSQWVGDAFAGKARAMADGETEATTIHGTATPQEAQALHAEGIAVMPLLFPVVPPDSVN